MGECGRRKETPATKMLIGGLQNRPNAVHYSRFIAVP
jgi:hypothetical protein